MFRNAQRDPLAVPEPVKRASVGPTRRTAYGPNDYAGNGPASAWLNPDEGYQHPDEARQRYIQEHGEPHTHPVHGPGHLKEGPLGKEFIPNNPSPDFSEFGDQLGEALHFGNRTAGVPWAETKLPGLRQHEQQDLDYQNWEGADDDPHADPERDAWEQHGLPSGYSGGPEGTMLEYPDAHNIEGPTRHYDGDLIEQQFNDPRFAKVSNALSRQARSFLIEQNTEDRSELLYRARRHASTQTSTWSENASHRATEAFVARVAELIPSARKVAAASPSHIEDFDDQLLY